jgi:hypothetical protein
VSVAVSHVLLFLAAHFLRACALLAGLRGHLMLTPES